MNIRRLSFDVDKATARPTIVEIAEAIHSCPGVKASNLAVEEIDMETVGLDVTIEGEGLDYRQIVAAIERTGAAVHSLDQIASGDRIIEHVSRKR
jgi:uncharacterized protein